MTSHCLHCGLLKVNKKCNGVTGRLRNLDLFKNLNGTCRCSLRSLMVDSVVFFKRVRGKPLSLQIEPTPDKFWRNLYWKFWENSHKITVEDYVNM